MSYPNPEAMRLFTAERVQVLREALGQLRWAFPLTAKEVDAIVEVQATLDRCRYILDREQGGYSRSPVTIKA